MDSLDIKIKVDPSQAVVGSKAATDALARVEKQGDKTNKTLDAGFKQLAGGMKEMAKGQVMMMIRDGIAGIAKELEEATGFGTKFAQMGAMFGPWGAAVGVAVDGAKALTDALFGMTEAEQKAAEETAAFLNAVRAQDSTIGKLVEQTNLLADAYDRIAKNKAFTDQVSFYQGLSKSTQEYKDALRLLNDNVDVNANFVQRRLDLSQGLRNATLAEALAAQGNGKAVIELAVAQQQGLDKAVELARGYATGAIAAERQTKAVKELTEAQKGLQFEKAPGRPGSIVDFTNSATGGIGAVPTFDIPALPAIAEVPQAIKVTEAAVSDLDKALQELNDGAAENLKNTVMSIGDAFVDWIFDAEFSWNKFFEQMSKDLLKMSIRQGLQFGITSLFGGRTGFDAMVPGGSGAFLPGFATGGDMLVGGAGAPDSKVAAFRVSPGESIHVRTPEQRQASQQTRQRTVVVEMPDGHRIRALMPDDADEFVIRAIERNPQAVRARLGR